MDNFLVPSGELTYIPWCCEEYVDSGAAVNDEGVAGSLAGTYLVTCTIPYATDGSGEVRGVVATFTGLGDPIREVVMSHKTSNKDTLVLVGMTVIPEGAVFRTSIQHDFGGEMVIYPQANIEICYLAPPTEVTDCNFDSWTLTVDGYNCGATSQWATMVGSHTITGFSYDIYDGYFYSWSDEFFELVVNGDVVASIQINPPDCLGPFQDFGSVSGLSISVADGDNVYFQTSNGSEIYGYMSAEAALSGTSENMVVDWEGCG